MQIVYQGYNSYKKISEIVDRENVKKILLVCGKSFEKTFLKKYFENLKKEVVIFSDFTPNPKYEQIEKGVWSFKKNNCDMIISVGGGSATDVAKCIKLFSIMNSNKIYLKQDFVDSGVCHLALPTTAGTGSESDRFAVCYYKGEKQSIAHESLIPKYVILDPKLLTTLPKYQKKVTMLDALCQSIESVWSVNANEISRVYAKDSIKYILKNYIAYLNEDLEAAGKILLGANLSGKAINITQTTAAHAMSYKITSMFGLPHGHAVALCLGDVWKFLCEEQKKIKNSYVENALTMLNDFWEVSDTMAAIDKYNSLVKELGIGFTYEVKAEQLEILVQSVNPVRLKNMPISLESDDIRRLYKNILNVN